MKRVLTFLLSSVLVAGGIGFWFFTLLSFAPEPPLLEQEPKPVESEHKAEAERQARLEAEHKAAEVEQQPRLEAERKDTEAEGQARLEAERQARLEAERQRLEAELKAEEAEERQGLPKAGPKEAKLKAELAELQARLEAAKAELQAYWHHFPWPPPLASATEVIPRKLLQEKSKPMQLMDVDRKIIDAIRQNGYYESSYFAVPKGFALVTRMEQIEPDGAPKKEPQRWSLEHQPMAEFSLAAYLKALLFASPGYYRVIVFVVTPELLTQSSSGPTQKEAENWLSSGHNRLPETIGNLKFLQAYTCTALIYEFERESESDEPRFRQPGRIPGHDHLVKAGIWASLQR